MKSTQEEILFVGFNQDYGCFTCGTTSGFRIYNTMPFKDTFHREFDGGIGIVEMLYRTNIIALVGGGERPKYPPNKVMLWDDSQMKCIGELNFKSDVKAVKLRKDKVIVVLEYKIYVYNFQNLKMIEVIETYENEKGLCSTSPSKEICVLACPDKSIGTVRVVHFDKGSKTLMFDAHQTALAAITLNTEGNILATASEKGTLIRLWDTETATKLQEVRRGSDSANVYCITFDSVSKYLACSSDKGTIHIFAIRSDVQMAANAVSKQLDIDAEKQEAAPSHHPKEADNVTNTKSILSFMRGILPSYFDSEWSFAQFRIMDSHAICSIREDKIVGISAEGNYYLAEIDKSGGECKKILQKSLIHNESEGVVY